MTSLHEIESLLQTYSIEDILEHNDRTVEEALLFLLDNNYIELPEPIPLDFEND